MNTPSLYSEELVLRVNELFHDLAIPKYGELHSSHIKSEGERWRRLAQRFLPAGPAVLADIGTGMGMVPVTIGPYLGSAYTVLASDISRAMLDAARANIENEGFPWKAEYVKLAGSMPFTLPYADGSIDVITMNSVLHHIKGTERFREEIDRVLKPGGLFFVGHEPNALFRERKILWYGYRLLYGLLNPKYALRSRPARALGLYRLSSAIFYRLQPERGAALRGIMSSMNEQLMREGLIRKPLMTDEIGEITDILDRDGFDPLALNPAYEVVHLESYNHIGQVSVEHGGNGLIRACDRWLRKRYPIAGGTFFLILRKPFSGAG